jgi:hypothetical protein
MLGKHIVGIVKTLCAEIKMAIFITDPDLPILQMDFMEFSPLRSLHPNLETAKNKQTNKKNPQLS